MTTTDSLYKLLELSAIGQPLSALVVFCKKNVVYYAKYDDDLRAAQGRPYENGDALCKFPSGGPLPRPLSEVVCGILLSASATDSGFLIPAIRV